MKSERSHYQAMQTLWF